MRTRIVVLFVIFIVVMALYGYLTPAIKKLVNGCVTVEDQMQYNQEVVEGCEE
jgi:quinol-cytochrome oxidoreductase complex cytochrome b subunit